MRRFAAMLAALIGLYGLAPTTHALVPMDAKGVNQAVRYGMERGRYGLSDLLGPNWIEQADGTLLNIYSPFMLVATQVAKSRFPADPTEKELANAKKVHGRIIRSVTNARYPQEVKFVLSLYGPSNLFQRTIAVKLEGVGHGKKFELKPSRRIIQKFAQPVGGKPAKDASASEPPKEYEAVNAYYFPFKTLEHLDEFDLTFYDYSEGSTFQPITYHINNHSIY